MEILNTVNPAPAPPFRNGALAPKEGAGANSDNEFSQTLAKASANSEPAQKKPSDSSQDAADQTKNATDDVLQTPETQNSGNANHGPNVNIALKKMPDWLRKLAEKETASPDTAAAEKSSAKPDLKAISKALEKRKNDEADAIPAITDILTDQAHSAEKQDSGSVPTDVQGLMSLLGSSGTLSLKQNPGDASAASLLIGTGMVKPDARGQGKGDSVKESAANIMKAMPSDDMEISTGDTDKLFRFLKADGSGLPQEMLITAEKDTDKVTELKATLQGKAENITVMDARRYLGFEQNENAGRVVAAIAGDKELASALKAAGSHSVSDPARSTGTVVNTLKIQMHPLDLGVITATMRLKADELTVNIQVHSGEAYRQLTLDQDKIARSLQDQGFSVDSVNIQLMASDRTSSNMSDQPQDRGQQQARDSSAGTFGQQGREQSGNSRRDQTYVSAPTVETNTPGTASDSVSAGIRPGQVYL